MYKNICRLAKLHLDIELARIRNSSEDIGVNKVEGNTLRKKYFFWIVWRWTKLVGSNWIAIEESRTGACRTFGECDKDTKTNSWYWECTISWSIRYVNKQIN